LVAILIIIITTNFSNIKKLATTLYLQTPIKKTIYEQNSQNNYPKTTIPIPKEKGYLLAVYKDKHILELLKNNELVKRYDVNIRREKEDRKIWEDNQTPEGIFTIETMDVITSPAWSRWMRVNTTSKAREIYQESHKDGFGRIIAFEESYGKINSDEKLRQFNEINSDQKILRGIGIHGGGFSLYRDWTEGCIALADKDVIELFDILSNSTNHGIGTEVIIQD